MREVTTFLAFDGTPFESREECLAYERDHSVARLAGLTIEQIEVAINGNDAELANLIEEIGAKIARERRKRGDLKRARNNKSGDTAEKSAAPALKENKEIYGEP